MSNLHLRKAQKQKNDNIMTSWNTAEAELKYYKKHFANKVVYLPCEVDMYGKDGDWHYSNGNAYYGYISFTLECFLREWKIKKLIITSIDSDEAKIFSIDAPKGTAGNQVRPKRIKLNEQGDFRSKACKKFWEEADIVVTNPPFSLFREFYDYIKKYRKQFLIIGHKTASIYKNVFPDFVSGNTWYGITTPKNYLIYTNPEDFWYMGETKKFNGMTKWYTNLENQEFKKKLVLTAKYDKEKYPKFDYYDAINVDRVKDIPKDYTQKMGVPVSYLETHNPDDFELIDAIGRYSVLYGKELDSCGECGCLCKARKFLSIVNGKKKFMRIIIRKQELDKDADLLNRLIQKCRLEAAGKKVPKMEMREKR